MDYVFILFMIAAFFAVVLLLEGLYQMWNASHGPEIQRINQRLQDMSAGSFTGRPALLIKQRLLSESPGFEKILLGVPRIQKLDRLIEQGGSSMSVAQFFSLTLLAALIGLMPVSYTHLTLPTICSV